MGGDSSHLTRPYPKPMVFCQHGQSTDVRENDLNDRVQGSPRVVWVDSSHGVEAAGGRLVFELCM